MKLQRTWMLLVSLLLVVAFSGCGDQQDEQQEKTAVREPELAAWVAGQPKLRGNVGDAIMSVAFSPDGKTLASGSKSIKLWDAVTNGTNTATLEGHTGNVSSVAFSPDGKTLASGSQDTSIKLWDVASGKNTATLEGHANAVYSVAFSPNGKTLASGSEDRTIKLWDVASGTNTATLKGHMGGVWSVAFGPDGKRLASGSVDSTIKLWDVAPAKK